MASDTQDISAIIDDSKIGSFQIGLVALCGLLLMFDGFDTQVIGYVAPAIVSEWKISRAALGPIFSSGLVGLMLGAFVFGPVADRLGRKPTICLCAAIFGVFTVVTSRATSVNELMLFRLVAGLGLGGAMPNAIALVAEFFPARARGRAITILVCGFSLGAALGGLLAAWAIPAFGWRSVIATGGIAPLVILPFLWFVLPESLRFLALRNPLHAAIGPTLRKIDPRSGDRVPVGGWSIQEQEASASPRLLFSHQRGGTTGLLWLAFFMNLVVLYFLSSYLPTVLNAEGVSIENAVLATALYQVGGLTGAVIIGFLIDKFRAPLVLGIALSSSTLFIAMIPNAHANVLLVCIGTFGAGFCIVGGQIGANALAGTLYPTSVRSTGVGWALGVGRLGSVTGPLLVTLLLSMQWTIDSIFYASIVPALIAATALLLTSFTQPRHRSVGSPNGQPTLRSAAH